MRCLGRRALVGVEEEEEDSMELEEEEEEEDKIGGEEDDVTVGYKFPTSGVKGRDQRACWPKSRTLADERLLRSSDAGTIGALHTLGPREF